MNNPSNIKFTNFIVRPRKAQYRQSLFNVIQVNIVLH